MYNIEEFTTFQHVSCVFLTCVLRLHQLLKLLKLDQLTRQQALLPSARSGFTKIMESWGKSHHVLNHVNLLKYLVNTKR